MGFTYILGHNTPRSLKGSLLMVRGFNTPQIRAIREGGPHQKLTRKSDSENPAAAKSSQDGLDRLDGVDGLNLELFLFSFSYDLNRLLLILLETSNCSYPILSIIK